jgi:multiple sugar transport system ATP-binding protein
VRASVVEDLGSESHVIFAIDTPRVVAEAVRAAKDTSEESSDRLLADDTRALFTARLDGQRSIAPGSELELAVDPRRLHFFDPATGAVL